MCESSCTHQHGPKDVNNIRNLHRTIERANESKNPLEPFLDEFSKYQIKSTKDNNGSGTDHSDAAATMIEDEITIKYKHKNDLDSKTLKWAFRLAEQNVRHYYESCSIGWTPKIKQINFNKRWARYLLAYDKQKNLIAYTLFRFDMDYGCAVLYCYEMQIVQKYQRKGLGTFVMAALYKIAKHYDMDKIVLTVLNNNAASMKFFGKLGYEIDDTSPDKSENTQYEILSIIIDKK